VLHVVTDASDQPREGVAFALDYDCIAGSQVSPNLYFWNGNQLYRMEEQPTMKKLLVEMQSAEDRINASRGLETGRPMSGVGQLENDHSPRSGYTKKFIHVLERHLWARHVLENQARVHEVEGPGVERLQVRRDVQSELTIPPIVIELLGQFDHSRRDVYANTFFK
jgi:hypothetical protein